MNKKIVYIIFSILIVAILTLTNNYNQIKTVDGYFLENSVYENYINITGVFESSDASEIKLSYPVFIKKVYVKENDYVNKGQILFSIDKEKMQEYISMQSINYNDIGNISKEDILSLISSISVLASDIYSLPNEVYASTEGTVKGLTITDNSIAMSGKTLCNIISQESIVAKITLSQTDYGKIKVGDKVLLSSVAFSDIIYEAEISDETAIIHKETTAMGSKVMVDVFAKIINPDNKIANGLQINGKILNSDNEVIKTIPCNIINQDSNGEYVYILLENKPQKTYVQTGIEMGDKTQILTPFEDDTVFLSGDFLDDKPVIVNILNTGDDYDA